MDIGVTNEVLQKMKEGTIDIGLVYLEPNKQKKDFRMFHVASEPILLVCAPDSPLQKKRPLTPNDIERERILVYKKTFISTIMIDKYFQEQGLIDLKKTEIKNLEWRKKMVEKGLGIAFIQKTFVRQELEDKKLVELPFSLPLPETPISILFSNELPKHLVTFVIRSAQKIFKGK